MSYKTMAPPRQSIDSPLLEDTEKQDLKTYQNSAAFRTQLPKDSHKMRSRRTLLLAFLICSLAALGIASVVAPRNTWQWPCPQRHGVEHGSVESIRTTFAESLKDVSPESLNDLLQKFFPAKFQHGVFPSEHNAAEAVHEADPAMVPALLQIAKRDGTNSSTTETTTSTSSSESTPPTSITSTTTTTRSATPTGTSTTPSVSSTTTGSTSASSTSSTLITRTETSTSSTSSLSSSRVVTTYTSTNANGGVVVVTATTYVLAGAEQTPSSTSTRPSGSLQTNAAPAGRGRNMGLELVMGAVVGGVLLV